MKVRRQLRIACAILPPAAALPAAGGIMSVQFSEPVVVTGKAITPGRYLLCRKTSSPETAVKIEKNGTTLADVRASLAEREGKSPYDSIPTVRNGAGELVVKEVRMRGKKQVLVFE